MNTRLEWERERFLECMALYKLQRGALAWPLALNSALKTMREKYGGHALQHNLDRALSGVMAEVHDQEARRAE